MKPQFWIKVISCLFLFVGLFTGCFSQSRYESSRKAVFEAEFPLDTSNYASDTFLPPNILANKKVIGLGESTHGTHEFFSIKDYIIRNQILHNNEKIVAMEAGFCSLLKFNEYLLNNNRPLDSLFYEFDSSGIYGVYFTNEVYQMLLWIKKYNLSQKEDSDKVQLFGIDMQDTYYVTLEILRKFPELTLYDTTIYDKLKMLNKLYYHVGLVKMSKEARVSYERLADDLSITIRRKANPTDTAFLLHLTELFRQSLELEYIEQQGLKISKARFNQAGEARDKFMAENVIWIQEHYCGGNDKILLWSHDGHIAHAYLSKSYRMGYYLKQHYKNNYYAIDFVFDEGSVRIRDAASKTYFSHFYPSATFKKSIEYNLKNSPFNIFFINLHPQNNDSEFASFFGKYEYQRIIGAFYQSNPRKDYFKVPILNSFDGLIFVKKAHAAENVKRVKK